MMPSDIPCRPPSADRLLADPAVTILLVEDDQQVRLATGAMLAAWGYRVLSAETDEQAMWLWDRHQSEIEVLLTDLMIPNQTLGTTLARRFRAAKPALRVILTSGFGPDIAWDVEDFPREWPFLQKPCDPGVLRGVLEVMTGFRGAQRAGNIH